LISTTWREIAIRGFFNFYTYLATGKVGNGTVRYRFRVTHFEYSPEEVPFVHDHGSHYDDAGRTARSILTLGRPEGSREIDIGKFLTVTGCSL